MFVLPGALQGFHHKLLISPLQGGCGLAQWCASENQASQDWNSWSPSWGLQNGSGAEGTSCYWWTWDQFTDPGTKTVPVKLNPVSCVFSPFVKLRFMSSGFLGYLHPIRTHWLSHVTFDSFPLWKAVTMHPLQLWGQVSRASLGVRAAQVDRAQAGFRVESQEGGLIPQSHSWGSSKTDRSNCSPTDFEQLTVYCSWVSSLCRWHACIIMFSTRTETQLSWHRLCTWLIQFTCAPSRT